MGTRHESEKATIDALGASLARGIEVSSLDDSAVSKFHDELASFDKETQLAVARAAFSQFQQDYNAGRTKRQLMINTENVQKAGQPLGQAWLHSMSIEVDTEKKPLDWGKHPVDSLSNSIENLLSADKKEIVLFEESQAEHKEQVQKQGARLPKFLDFEALSNQSSQNAQ